MSEINEKEIIFITPTVGSIWMFYQNYLIKKLFPESKTAFVNGNKRWDFNLKTNCVWYDFIKVALDNKNKDYKYFIHIDEDCFLYNKQGIINTIEEMEKNDYALAGPTDTMWPIRGGNPHALNSFFMIGKIQDLKEIWNDYEFNLLFKDLQLPIPEVPEEKIEDEPYYNFFWNYLKHNKKIYPIKTGFYEPTNSTTLLYNDNEIFVHHMWYTRRWYTNEKFVNLTHRKRYLSMKKMLDLKFSINVTKLLSSMDYSQYLPIANTALFYKNIKRIQKKLFKRP